MADLLTGQIQIIGLAHLASFSAAVPPLLPSLPPSFQSQLLRKRLLWDAVAESKSSPWQRHPVCPPLKFSVFV